ncbi:hypothetical protein NDU88_006168 [Pleurodeles waltl]|uniref:Uncharacterized protein n=1 Tax=Pleurodeles waltl TaxID=8319 RepID=A0AAV7VL54_PLEWA|nr:hypothetical protein NDU88_006168 [Pleurodeles waltl]
MPRAATRWEAPAGNTVRLTVFSLVPSVPQKHTGSMKGTPKTILEVPKDMFQIKRSIKKNDPRNTEVFLEETQLEMGSKLVANLEVRSPTKVSK